MTPLTFEPFDPREAPDALLRDYWALQEALHAERLPDDPPLPFEVLAGRLRNEPPYVRSHVLLARDAAHRAAVGAATIGMDTSGENAHMAQFGVEVLPSFRRRGLGRRLLRFVAEAARDQGRRRLLCGTTDLVPSGAAFLRAAGAEPGLEQRHSQLVLAELDRDLLRRWQAQAQERAAGFELLAWDDKYPDEQIEAFATLCEVMNSAPRGELELDDQTITPAKVRQWLAMMHAAGVSVWTMIARERATGALVGMTELLTTPGREAILNQGATGVEPAYRNLGLGRWLKAAMLERVLQERPEARFVRTDNAEMNAPMLAINDALGFRPFMTATIWQLETARALAFAGA